MARRTKSLAVILIFFFLINLLLWGRYLLNLTLNGDDVYMLVEVLDYLYNFTDKLLDVSGQYRPLGRLFYLVYYPQRFSFSSLYFLHLVFYSLIQWFFFIVVRKKLNFTSAIILTLFIFLNPIFYYHIFTIAADVNLIIIFILLLMIWLIEEKKYLLTIPLFLVSIFLKETFILLLPLVFLAIYKSSLNRKKKISLATCLSMTTGGYFLIRSLSYQQIDSAYSFVFTFQKGFENIGNFAAWLLNHPRGGEFGYYGFRNLFNYLNSLMILVIWTVGFINAFIKKNAWLIILVSVFLLSLSPFIFLNRTLLFYMDVPFMTLGLLLAYFVTQKTFKYLMPVMIVSIILSYAAFFNKWISYSFVANSQLIASNLMTAIQPHDLDGINEICIMEHGLGSWPTSKGRIIYLLRPEYNGKIYSLKGESSKYCQDQNRSLSFRNENVEYILIE